jgi:hypothetical protein
MRQKAERKIQVSHPPVQSDQAFPAAAPLHVAPVQQRENRLLCVNESDRPNRVSSRKP